MSQYVQVFHPHACIFRHCSQFVCPRWTFSPAVFILEDLLGAGGGDVQESPGCIRVQLLLVTTQCPNIHHPHHFLLWKEVKSRGSDQKSKRGGGWRAVLDLISNFRTSVVQNLNLLWIFLTWPAMRMYDATCQTDYMQYVNIIWNNLH